MKAALLGSETINNPVEDDDRCAVWRPRIIESAGERDFLLGRSQPRHPDSSLGYDHPAFPEVALTTATMPALIASGRSGQAITAQFERLVSPFGARPP